MSQPACNPVVGPTTTGQVTLAGQNAYFAGMVVVVSAAASVIVRSGSASGPPIGTVNLAAAGQATLYNSQPLVKCQGGLFVTITGTVTELTILVA